MENWRNDRRTRRRGRDEDSDGGYVSPSNFGYAERPSEVGRSSLETGGPEVGATVKWFNPEKGFGFVSPKDGSPDAFIHANVVRRAGHETLNEGDELRVRLGPGQRGIQVTEVTDVQPGQAPVRAARPPRAGGRDFGPTREVRGTVKWFNPEKGFGFVSPNDGGKDVFVHIRCLERCGLSALAEGTPLVLQVTDADKGPEARSVALG